MTAYTRTKLSRAMAQKGKPNTIIGYREPEPRFIVRNPNINSIVPQALVARGEMVNWRTRELRKMKNEIHH